MTYRRSDESGVFSSRWRLDNRSRLHALGIPTEVTDSGKRWAHLLLHGYDPESKWELSWLSDSQGAALLEFLDPQVPNSMGIWLIEDLRRRWKVD
jgi:hypothetical protein